MSEFYRQLEQPEEQLIEAIRYVSSKKEVRSTEIQLKFLCGYNRARRILDDLEELGVVGPFRGVKPWEVLTPGIDAERFLEERRQSNG